MGGRDKREGGGRRKYVEGWLKKFNLKLKTEGPIYFQKISMYWLVYVLQVEAGNVQSYWHEIPGVAKFF